ncbi:MAG TPA: SDR family oxidoreductase [Anaerolineae bacterium]|nr:SDR family oxidoreductase [Anaerolineae bacterium]MCB0177464.1 SDR family oxidoreductase [Anaerolineae bacterium]MCB9105401.1 SDR family oxidoreductase [Anaerolineales bacterium]HRV90842.1 SDR family oxidoreductase [Anaerolineae bacterium]
MRLKDRVAIVTGGGRGIGEATCLRFAEEGAKVIVADIDFDVATEVANEVNGAISQARASAEKAVGGGEAVATSVLESDAVAVPFHLNVTDRKSVADMVESTLERFGRIDVLVNNAGTIRDSQVLKMSEENFDLVININLKGVFNCTQLVLPTMVEQRKGVILSTSSLVAPYGNYGQTNYVASKAGVVGMTKVWARELGRKGIRVNAVAPGFIKTRLTAGIPDKVVAKLLERIPMGHFGEPVDIANAFVWLASDEAKYVSGHVFAVDGGAVL